MWWSNDSYDSKLAIAPHMLTWAGPNGLALVNVYKNGKTDPGWGGDTFMSLYDKGLFQRSKIVRDDSTAQQPFAFVMRSMSLVCIDIDGKNGGLEHAGKMGMLPVTLAETSKSGDGFHLFYSVGDTWDNRWGFAKYRDRIGIKQGVDFRGVGCVYHYPGQRWNMRPIVALPKHIDDLMTQRQQKEAATVAFIEKTLATGDKEEIAIMHDDLITELSNSPKTPGKRNNSLFAIGTQMKLAGIANWEQEVYSRALVVGLDSEEADKLVRNISKYGVATTP